MDPIGWPPISCTVQEAEGKESVGFPLPTAVFCIFVLPFFFFVVSCSITKFQFSDISVEQVDVACCVAMLQRFRPYGVISCRLFLCFPLSCVLSPARLLAHLHATFLSRCCGGWMAQNHSFSIFLLCGVWLECIMYTEARTKGKAVEVAESHCSNFLYLSPLLPSHN